MEKISNNDNNSGNSRGLPGKAAAAKASTAADDDGGGGGTMTSSSSSVRLDPRLSLTGHSRGINDVAWSPTAAYVATASDDKTLLGSRGEHRCRRAAHRSDALGVDSNLLIKEQSCTPSSASLTDVAAGEIVDANTIATALGRRSLTEYRVVAKPSINRSSSLPLDGHYDEAVFSPPSLRDAFNNSKRLSISESTRRLLESMDESQVRHAEVSLSNVKRLRSGILKDNVKNDDKDEHQEGNDGEKARAIDDIVPSEPNSQPNDEWEPPSLNFAKPLGRRKGTEAMSCSGIIQNTSFKPISSSTVNYDYFNDVDSDDDDDDKRKSNPGETNGWGLGSIWNKLTSKNAPEGNLSGEAILEEMLDADGTGITKKASPIAKSKKRINVSGGTKASAPYDYYIRRGKKKAGKGEYLQAVALYNLALIRQRDDLGVDHIDCATTLNEIGICWMMLSERYLALSAYEESLYIRQKHLGDGAMEVAETTNNIWMVLHEERCEIMEREDNGEVIPGVEGGGDVNSTNDVENQEIKSCAYTSLM